MTVLIGLFASISIFLIPIGIGNLLLKLLSKIGQAREIDENKSYTSLLSKDFPIGALFIFALILITKSIDPLNMARDLLILSFAMGLIAYFQLMVTVITIFNYKTHRTDFVSYYKITGLIHCFVLALLSQFIWKWKSGIHSSLDWDTFFHQMIVNNIIDGKFSLVTSHISDSVRINAYSSIFHSIIAIPFDIFHPDVLIFWWFAGFLQLFLITLTSFAVGSAVYEFVAGTTKTKTSVIYLAGMITSAITALSFLSYQAYNPYFLIPQILTATIAGCTLATLLHELKKNTYDFKNKRYRLIFLSLLPSIVFSVLNHYVLGTYGVLFLLMIYCIHLLDQRFPAIQYASLSKYMSILLLVLIPFVLRYFNLVEINPKEASFYVTDLYEKIHQLNQFYGYLWPVLTILGLVKLIKIKTANSNIIIAFFVLFTASLIAPIPYNLKFLAFGSLLVHAIMALGLIWIIEHVATKYAEKHYSWIIRLTLCALIVGLTVNLINNIIVYKQTPTYQNVYTHISQNEHDAATFIKNKYGNTKAMILSDPATMFTFEAISGINTPGGAYVDENIRNTLTAIYFSRDASQIQPKLMAIKDGVTGPADTYLLVLSHRYFEWLNSGDEQVLAYSFNVWQPIDLRIEDYNFVNYLTTTANLPIVYRNNGVVVLELKR